MSVHLNREIDNLKARILELSTLVEENVWRAVRSIERRDAKLAEEALNSDARIDAMEIEVEEECLKILALHQPVAIDLRFIVALLKINNDLERIGDLAINIAERGSVLAMLEEVDMPFDFPGMAAKAQWMLREGLDALVNMDTSLAHEVRRADDQVDEINRRMYAQVKEGIRSQPQHMEQFIHLLCVSRHIERIGDHASNIAEDVIYMAEGQIVRHRKERYESVDGPSQN